MAPRLLQTLTGAPWLPPGSAAEAWTSLGPGPADPVAIVRLLLTRRAPGGGRELFCIGTDRGLDLPTRRLAGAGTAELPVDGLARLVEEVVGRQVPVRCVGWIRNVVPEPDETYPLPAPYACVPVYVPSEPTAPILPGTWVAGAEDAPEILVRHWWPVVRHHLA